MYRYKYNKSYHRKSKRARRTTFFAVSATAVVVVAIGYVALDVFKSLRNVPQPVSQPQYSSVQGATVNLFKTEYFQFQAGESWKAIPTETREGHYVYRSYKGLLVERDITVDVNKTTPEVAPLVRTTRVMPVEIEADGRLAVVEGAGEHCVNAMPKGAPLVPTKITSKKVSFICTPDAAIYQVSVGEVGGSTNLSMLRSNDQKATYSITYRDLTVASNDSHLRNIVSTFQAR